MGAPVGSPVYQQLCGSLKGCSISSAKELRVLMIEVAIQNKFTVVAEAFHQFQPQGATGALVLAESHFTMHTYPELDLIYVDVFCCSNAFDPHKCAETLESIFKGKGEWQFLTR